MAKSCGKRKTSIIGCLLLFLPILLLQACAARPRFTDNPRYQRISRHDPTGDFHVGQVWIGWASFYGKEHDGKKTSSGEVFDMMGLTAAHRYLPFGTVLKVENLKTGKSCELNVNDRGPWIPGRILDVSQGGAKSLGMLGDGVAEVKITILKLRI